MEEILDMTNKEIERYAVLERVRNKTLSQMNAAKVLNISTRQVRNLLNLIINNGKKGLISKKRKAPSNHQLNPVKRVLIISLIKEFYIDFGPTFACEKLEERHNIKVSVETVRNIMIKEHIWFCRQSRKKVHQRRERRACFGELIQADASTHLWFEDRRDKCALTVLIDDATSCITALHFTESECLVGYKEALKFHMKKYGRPMALYTDRHAIFKTTRSSGKVAYKDTKLKSILSDLDIALILARTPQAKGRVERANQTLQDRLIKEMRLRGIKTIEEANEFLPEYIKVHNKKFGRKPLDRQNVHRDFLPNQDLDQILRPKAIREISKDLTVQYRNTLYQLNDHTKLSELRGKKVEVREVNPGKIEIWHKEKKLNYTEYNENDYVEPLAKLRKWGKRGNHKNKWGHPWTTSGSGCTF